MPNILQDLFNYTDLPQITVKEKGGKKENPLDQWYTQDSTAQYCIKKFHQIASINGYDLSKYTFIEPSAGNNSFGKFLPKKRRILLDIDPKHEDVKQADFLSWAPEKIGSYAVIGNPPFGSRGLLALAFINRSSEFADILGFILPMNFATDSKMAAKAKVRKFHCLHQEELSEKSFYLSDGKIPTVFTIFQVWGKNKPLKKTIDFTCNDYVSIVTITKTEKSVSGIRWMDQCSCFLATTFYGGNRMAKITTDFDEVFYGSGLGIIIKKDPDKILQALGDVNWIQYSSKATNGCRHIQKENVYAALINRGFIDKSKK